MYRNIKRLNARRRCKRRWSSGGGVRVRRRGLAKPIHEPVPILGLHSLVVMINPTGVPELSTPISRVPPSVLRNPATVLTMASSSIAYCFVGLAFP